jgi:cyclic pyranopterin phosphate synthase
MEALVAVAGALLSIYDMAKSIDRGMSIEAVRLESKAGGRSGEWSRATPPSTPDPGAR